MTTPAATTTTTTTQVFRVHINVTGDVVQGGGGWPFILSDLKSLLETGSAMGD